MVSPPLGSDIEFGGLAAGTSGWKNLIDLSGSKQFSAKHVGAGHARDHA